MCTGVWLFQDFEVMTTALEVVVMTHVLLLVCMGNCSHVKTFQVPLVLMDVSVGGAQVRQAPNWHQNEINKM